MALKVAINGFGRIGRCFLRSAYTNGAFEVVHINDLVAPRDLAHLLKHDTVHRNWDRDVQAVEGGIEIDGRLITVSAEKDPTKLPWGDKGVDTVLECTGLFTAKPKAMAHVQAGAKRVIISAPATEEDLTLCMGVNDELLDLSKHQVISNASCTTNCLAPMAKVLHETFGIEHGLMTTIHSYTMDQNLLDNPHRKGDLRRARASALNMVPSSTGAAKAVGLVLPALKGKLTGMSMRVPTPNVSIVDLTFSSAKPVTKDAINAALVAGAQGPLKGILDARMAPLVSSDLIGDKHSCIVDLEQTLVVGTNMAKVFGWYDNEWGFSNRMVDLCAKIAGMV